MNVLEEFITQSEISFQCNKLGTKYYQKISKIQSWKEKTENKDIFIKFTTFGPYRYTPIKKRYCLNLQLLVLIKFKLQSAVSVVSVVSSFELSLSL